MAKRRKKYEMKTEEILIRMGISAIIVIVTCIAFFLGGGLTIFKKYSPKETVYSQNFEVHFIDVGQGDSTLIYFPDGKTMLIDCGEKSESEGLVSYLNEVFKSHEIEAIDYLIFTHQDSDHIGGGEKVLSSFQVNNVYRPMQYSKFEVNQEGFVNNNNYAVSDSATYSKAIEAVYNEPNCEMFFTQSGQKILGADYEVEFLTPLSVSPSLENNNYSPLIMLEYNGAKFLFTGDAESKIENEAALKYGEYLKADVYKVGHHGSSTSSSAKFLNEVLPEYAIVSAGKKNSYGHPTQTVLNRLQNVGAEVLTTIELGTIVLSVDEKGKVIILSHNTPHYDITIALAVGMILLMLTWGIKVNKSGKNEKLEEIDVKNVKKAIKTVKKSKKR